jgi:hypothetical protein
MAKPHRPYIKMNISRWEFFLIVTHLAIITLQIMYYVLRWDSIPEIILAAVNPRAFRQGANHSKYDHACHQILFYFSLMMFSIFFSFYMPKKGYSIDWKGRSLSHDMAKAERQYRIEISNLLCISLVIYSFYLLNDIASIEKQIELGIAVVTWTPFPQAIIAALISWRIHHVLWTRLSDK